MQHDTVPSSNKSYAVYDGISLCQTQATAAVSLKQHKCTETAVLHLGRDISCAPHGNIACQALLGSGFVVVPEGEWAGRLQLIGWN